MAFLSLLIYILILFIRPMEWVPWLLDRPILDYVAAAVSLAWLGSLLGRQVLDPFKAPHGALMLGFFFATLMSHVSHVYFEMFVNTFESMGKIVLIYFFIATLLVSIRKVKAFTLVLVSGCLFMTIHGMLQTSRGFGFGGALPLTRDNTLRVRAFGFFHDPNDLALILVVMLPFVLRSILGKGTAFLWRCVSIVAAGMMLYCIYLTNSRGGWLALGIMAIVYFYLNYSKKAGTVLLAIALPLLVVLGPSRMANLSSEDSSSRGRLVAWSDGNSMLKDWPIFGAGKGRYMEFSEDGKVAHNSFVHCYGELGLFGYFFWLALIIASLKDGRALIAAAKKLEDNPEYRKEDTGPPASLDAYAPAPPVSVKALSFLAKDLIAALAGYLAAGFFLSRTYEYPLFILFAMFATLRSLYERDHGHLEGAFARKDLKLTLAAVFGSIIAIYIMINVAW